MTLRVLAVLRDNAASLTLLGVLFSVIASIAGQAWAGEPSEQEVTFKGIGGVDMAGTLILPAGEPGLQFPVMILLAGSGPTDRDGNQPPTIKTDLLKQIATGLAKHGVASLRFDKRGMHGSVGGLPGDVKDYGDFFTWENFVEDVIAAYDFVRERPEIVSNRVGILGHSEGGLLTLVVADKLGEQGTSPTALVLISTPGRKFEAMITDQLKKLLAKQGADEQQTKFFLDESHRIAKAIQETGKVPLDVPAGLAALYPAYLGKFLQSIFAVDSYQLAAGFKGPVLVIEGEKDTQQSPVEDAKAFEAALKSRTSDDHRIIMVPGASHNLKVVKDENDPGFSGDVAPGVLDKLCEWAATKLGKPTGRK